MTDKKPRKKRDIRSFIPDPDVAEMLETAVAAGYTVTHLMNLAVRKHGPEVLRGMAKEMRDRAAELEKKISANKH